jgi:hypothetical protein
VCLYVYPPIVARQRLGKNPPIVTKQRLGRNVTAVTNTHATIKNCWTWRFQCGPCRIKESRRLVLPRTSCPLVRLQFLDETTARCEMLDMTSLVHSIYCLRLCVLYWHLWMRKPSGSNSTLGLNIFKELENVKNIISEPIQIVLIISNNGLLCLCIPVKSPLCLIN